MSKSETYSVNIRVSQHLAAARKAKGITQAALASALKKPQSFVSKIENAQRQITISDFITICGIIGIKPATLLNRLSS